MFFLQSSAFDNRSPHHWTDPQTANFISAVTAFLTLHTLIVALYQSFKARNDAEELAAEEKERNRLQRLIMKDDARPNFQIPQAPLYSLPFDLQLVNTGKRAIVTGIEVSENFQMMNPFNFPNVVVTVNPNETLQSN